MLFHCCCLLFRTLDTMSSPLVSPLVVVVELDGFQQGPDAFTPKCLAVSCDRLEFSQQWVFNTSALASRSFVHLSTYHHQATFVHGFPLTSPGVPQDLLPKVLLHTLDQLLFELFQSNSGMPIPDHFLLFTKGAQKLEFLRNVVRNASAQLQVQFRNLEDLRCPRLDHLAPETRNRPVPTAFKANQFAIWLAGQGVC